MYLESVFRKGFCRYPLDVKLCQMKKIHLENAFGNCFWGYPLALDVKLYQMMKIYWQKVDAQYMQIAT